MFKFLNKELLLDILLPGWKLNIPLWNMSIYKFPLLVTNIAGKNTAFAKISNTPFKKIKKGGKKLTFVIMKMAPA